MAAREEQKVSLKLMIDRERNRVVFAESNHEFVDILFSFLTMPMGTIVRVLAKQSQPAEFGSLTNLYRGVADHLDTNLLWTETCKTMLLHPINSAESLCHKLRLNIDDSDPTKFFLCSNKSCHHNKISYSSTQKHMSCSCGCLMNEEIRLNDESDGNGVFVNVKEKFMITDDLQVMPTTTASICALLNTLGISNIDVLYTKTVNIGLQEISRILNFSLISLTPMTDIFLRDQVPLKNVNLRQHDLNLQAQIDAPSSVNQAHIKLVLQKSNNTILYAEASKDFVDLLFSFLTLPLGSVVELLNGNSMLGSIDNLYRTVGDMKVGRYMSEYLKSMLLHPKLFPQYSCENQLLDVKEIHINDIGKLTFIDPKDPELSSSSRYSGDLAFVYELSSRGIYFGKLTFIDPKVPELSRSRYSGGYVNGSAMFSVTDSLVVEPLSSIWTIDLLTKLNVLITDLEERLIDVGKEKALCLLKASLISNMALNVGLNSMLKKIKQEV